MTEPETGVLPGALRAVQLYVCYQGKCPPRTERGVCDHGTLEQVTYLPIAITYKAIDDLHDRIMAALDRERLDEIRRRVSREA